MLLFFESFSEEKESEPVQVYTAADLAILSEPFPGPGMFFGMVNGNDDHDVLRADKFAVLLPGLKPFSRIAEIQKVQIGCWESLPFVIQKTL